MVAESSFKGFPGPWEGGVMWCRGTQRKCNVWLTVASVHLHLPPESLAAGSPLQEGKRASDGGW